MGLGSSRKRYEQRSYGYNQNKYQQQKHQSQRKITNTTSIPIFPSNSNYYYPNGSVYPYSRLQPSPYPTINYNAYPVGPQTPQPYMMMMPPTPSAPRLPVNTPSPYYNPSAPLPPPPRPAVPPPNIQQQVPVQPVYNNNIFSSPPVAPAPVATPYYPPVYQSSPARLLTDWTGGGQISPGFLGPPI